MFSVETREKQMLGHDMMIEIGDAAYVDGATLEIATVTLWGGLEVTIHASVAMMIAIQEAGEAQGDDALWTIRAGR